LGDLGIHDRSMAVHRPLASVRTIPSMNQEQRRHRPPRARAGVAVARMPNTELCPLRSVRDHRALRPGLNQWTSVRPPPLKPASDPESDPPRWRCRTHPISVTLRDGVLVTLRRRAGPFVDARDGASAPLLQRSRSPHPTRRPLYLGLDLWPRSEVETELRPLQEGAGQPSWTIVAAHRDKGRARPRAGKSPWSQCPVARRHPAGVRHRGRMIGLPPPR
jgi:hypothetical protein